MILGTIVEDVENYTISFLDMTRYLQAHGIQSRSYQMNWAQLVDTLGKKYAPVVINYDKPDQHFALLLYIADDYAFVADPARGFEFVSKKDFEYNYSGYALLTASETAKKNTVYISRVIDFESHRLERLQNLARRIPK